MNDLALQEDKIIDDLKKMDTMCQFLMKTPHYKRMGAEGIFAIVQKAKTLGVHPLDALNGGLYFVQGKVEMSSQMMAQLIRQAGHSVTKDQKSDDSICILHGKRKDNGDTWTETFSIQDAKRAGIYKEAGPWGKYPRNMLYARALSNLGRQLFPDVIKGCYVEGEIRDAPPLFDPPRQTYNDHQVINADVKVSVSTINSEQIAILEEAFVEFPEYKEQLMDFMMKHKQLSDVRDIPSDLFPKILKKIEQLRAEKEEQADEEELTVEAYRAAQGE